MTTSRSATSALPSQSASQGQHVATASAIAALELLALTCIAVAWLVPDKFIPWTSAYNESFALAGVLLLALSQWPQVLAIKPSTIVWAVLAVVLVPTLQWTFGLLKFSGDVWVSAMYLSAFAVAITTGQAWSSGNVERMASRLAAAVVAGAALTGVLALAQALKLEVFSTFSVVLGTGSRPSGNLGQSNNAATLFGFGMVSLLLLREQGRLGTLATLFLLVPLIAAVVTTLSRMALLFGPITMVFLALARGRGQVVKTAQWALLALTAIQWLLAWRWPDIQSALLLPAAENLAQRGMDSPRLHMWPMLFDSLSQVPWHGFGWLQVGEAQLLSVNKYPALHELWMHGHNVFVDLLVWCGYPLGLLLSGGLLAWFVSRVSRVKTRESVFAMLCVTLFGLHCMLELPYHFIYFLVPVGLWIGLIEASLAGARRPPWSGDTMPTRRWLVNAVPLACCAVLAACIAKDYAAVEEDFRLVRFESHRIGSVKAAQPAPDAPFLSSLTAFLRNARSQAHVGMTPAELQAMESITNRYPYSPSLAKLAVAYALNGRVDDARECFISIRKLSGDRVYRSLRSQLQERAADPTQAPLSRLLAMLPD